MNHKYQFEEQPIWQKSQAFTKSLYQATRSFPQEELNGITAQIIKASVAVSTNLANAHTTEKEFMNYYHLAKSKGLEVINLLVLCSELGYLSKETYASLRKEMQSFMTSILLS